MEEVEGERLSVATLDRHSVLSTSFHPPEDRVPPGSTISEKIEKFLHVLTLYSTVVLDPRPDPTCMILGNFYFDHVSDP
jgi:hypothetical protein